MNATFGATAIASTTTTNKQQINMCECAEQGRGGNKKNEKYF